MWRRFDTTSSRILLTLVVPCLATPGCGTQTAGGFNKVLADLQTKVAAAEKKVEDTMEWPPNDPAKKKAASDEFRTAVADARKRFDELKVPEGDAAKKFYDGFNDYLKTQEEAVPLYKTYLDPAGKLTREEDQSNREGIEKMRAKRTPLLGRLVSLQHAYASEAGVQLKK